MKKVADYVIQKLEAESLNFVPRATYYNPTWQSEEVLSSSLLQYTVSCHHPHYVDGQRSKGCHKKGQREIHKTVRVFGKLALLVAFLQRSGPGGA